MNIHGKNSADNCYICDERATTKYCGKKMCLDCARKAYYYAGLIGSQQKESLPKRVSSLATKFCSRMKIKK